MRLEKNIAIEAEIGDNREKRWTLDKLENWDNSN